MSFGEIGQAVIEALTALFNGIADYPIAWEDIFILIGVFAAVFLYFFLFNLLIGPIKEAVADFKIWLQTRKAAKDSHAQEP